MHQSMTFTAINRPPADMSRESSSTKSSKELQDKTDRTHRRELPLRDTKIMPSIEQTHSRPLSPSFGEFEFDIYSPSNKDMSYGSTPEKYVKENDSDASDATSEDPWRTTIRTPRGTPKTFAPRSLKQERLGHETQQSICGRPVPAWDEDAWRKRLAEDGVVEVTGKASEYTNTYSKATSVQVGLSSKSRSGQHPPLRREVEDPSCQSLCGLVHTYFRRAGLKWPRFNHFSGSREEFFTNLQHIANCSFHDWYLRNACLSILESQGEHSCVGLLPSLPF